MLIGWPAIALGVHDQLIDAQDREVEITPRVRSLRGVLAGPGLDESDYRRHLEEKYR